ncbi:Tn3 family transposase [Sphingobium yanoikuyae]|uniref:Tn3 family transposase n=1 Tax=Sphingobium yanoikuyae TaxID=13690 RepID=A0A9X7UK60_SPHYA|nr:Tn3 family transposase [Sphingobium yanoikuyae]QNG48405.1 Tn3 family transposase [Sphingobium yanoikuyae]
MTKRKHQLLTESERDQILAIPTDRDHLARLYTFEPSDIEIIGARREQRNQLGVALQLALLRHPGITLAQLIQDRGAIPHDLAAFVAEQLGLHVTELANYAARDQTMTDHARVLAARLGLRGPTRADIPFMIEAAARTAWATDKGMTIATGAVTALREVRILLPSISTIERASSAGRARARKQAAYALIADLSAEQVHALDQLFDAAGGMSHLALLKTIPVAAKPDHVRQILDRLWQVRKIGISPDVAGRIHADRFRQYVREGRASPAYMIERYIPSRRRATLVAFLLDLEERLTDSALEMADKLIGSIFTRAKNAQARSYATTSKNVARLMLIFRRTIDALTDAVDTGEDPIEALDASVGWHTLLKARPEVATIAETANLDPLRVAADRYATLRKFAPDLLEALQFRAGKGSAKTIAAIEMLRDLNRSGKRDLPADAPMPFRKEWRKIVVGDDGKINRRLWEIATIAHLRNKLRSGDVWVERSTGYRQFDSYLLSEPKAKPIVSALGLPPTAGEWLEQRGRELDWRLKKFAQRLKRDALEGVRYRDGRLQISPVRTIATPDAEALADRLDAMMPRIRITELLHEVAQETGFLSAFTNLRTGELCPNENALLATILADATNLGLSRMAAASQGVTRDQLLWTHDAYIRDESYRAALAVLINAHHRLPFSRVWGDGTTSSSDGQFFRGAKRGASGGDINARYGVDHGFSFYTHVSDQRGPYHVNVISAATHEAPYVLDGLISHGTDLRIVEHYTDTGGATDHVFALCAMLGFRFCPRLRDFPDRRLAPIAPVSAYPSIAPLLGKRIRTDIINEQWDDVLRLVGSIKAGHVAPSVMLRKLAAYERQNQLDVALQEIGKIERTLFMLDWLENPDLRRRCHAGLNNSEQRHALTQAIYTFRQGRIIDRSHEAQQYRASGLNLVIAAIVYWNTIYMADAAQHLRSAAAPVPDDLLVHTSPVGWEHIAFSGDFLWDRAAASAGRKALNLPPDSRAA